ncbi:serine/threonine-protein kinase [Neorhodopirellula lusitana]|uniref:serine/threonine-protein kinase n=1 Tax=Neorhodopirellula lusitana TaxID=445327 RepID=UPI00384F7D13
MLDSYRAAEATDGERIVGVQFTVNDTWDSSQYGGSEGVHFEGLSSQQMLVVNRWCDRYEKLWSNMDGPSLAVFAQSIELKDVAAFQALCLELTAIDVHYRRLAGQSVQLQSYVELFPAVDQQAIRDILLPVTAAMENGETLTSLSVEGELGIGHQIGDYIIEERIGCGGMGSVYRARHQLMGRVVAIKALTLRTRQDPASSLRFEREIESVAKMSHSNVVAAFDARLQDGSLYLVTEWIQGKDLGEIVLERGALPVAETLDIAIQAARGLAYAHSVGYLHRDVKPSNLMLDVDGNVKVLDLGLAKLFEQQDDTLGSTPLTAEHQVLGTAEYLSPEQAKTPNGVDVRTDIYSLGCTLMFLLTGKPPFVGESPIDTLLEHINTEPPSLTSFVIGQSLPEELSALVHAMLSKKVAERPATMQAVVEELVQIRNQASGNQTVQRPDWSLRRSWLSWLVVTAILLAAIGLVIAQKYFGDSQFNSSRFAFSDNQGDGLLFNGLTSYAEVRDFDVDLDRPVMVEVIATPHAGPLPSNLVTWGGDNLFALFAGYDQKWGVASLVGGVSRLEVSRDSFELNRSYLLAAKREGDQIELWVNGRRVSTRHGDYDLESSRLSLCFGGVPEGYLPRHQGTRFFAGAIQQVKISKGKNLQPAQSDAEILLVAPSTVALFDLTTGGSTEAKSSVNGFRAHLFDTRWIREEAPSLDSPEFR